MTSIVRQVTRASLLVAAFAVLAMAIAAVLTSRVVSERSEEDSLRRSAAALAEAVRHELVDEKLPLSFVAPDSIKESGLADDAVEIWSERTLVATNRPNETVGRGAPGEITRSAAWLAVTLPVTDSVELVVASPRDRGERALRIFGWSLALAAPLGLLAAILVGHRAARRVTQPLMAFRDRFLRVGPLDRLAPPNETDPTEVRELDQAFRAQWQRVKESFDREREFAANAAHELRTPLTRLRLLAERLNDGSDEGKEVARRQLTEIARMSRLVDALLVLARSVESGPGASDAVNLADLVRSAAALVFAEAPPPEIQAADEVMVRGDEDLLRIAVLNLLENARKFGADGGGARVELTDDREAVCLRVTTTGARIEGAARELVFDRFYRGPEARAQTSGHGLGLNLARHIARMHGGDLSLVSREGDDAAFQLVVKAWDA